MSMEDLKEFCVQNKDMVIINSQSQFKYAINFIFPLKYLSDHTFGIHNIILQYPLIYFTFYTCMFNGVFSIKLSKPL